MPKILCLLLLLIAPLTVNAVPITTSIGSFDISTINGTYPALSSTLQAQPWWGSVDLAVEFAGFVGDTFGTPNNGVFGPFFTFSASSTDFVSAGWCLVTFCSSSVDEVGLAAAGIGFNGQFAVASASAVPEPTSIALLGMGLALLGLTRYKGRKQVGLEI